MENPIVEYKHRVKKLMEEKMKKLMVLVAMAMLAGSVFAQKATKWMAQGDADNGGTSTAVLTEKADGIEVSGKVTTDYQYGYATAFVIEGDAFVDALKAGKGVKLTVTGDGKKYDLRVETSDRPDYAFHRFTFEAPKGKNATYTITYDKLKQYEWGSAKKFDQSKIQGVSIQTIGQPIPAYSYKVVSLEIIK